MGVTEDDSKAVEWFTKAEKQGFDSNFILPGDWESM
jgi:TPR repeat protein